MTVLLGLKFKKDGSMKKITTLLFTSALLLNAEVDYTKNLSADIRAVYINYTYDKGYPDAEAFATSLKLKYEQEIVDGLTGGIAFGTAPSLFKLQLLQKFH